MTQDRALQRRKAAYAHAVGEALAHLPAADREAILEDLEEHIDDAFRAAGPAAGAAELEQVLAALGSPEAYAADQAVSAAPPVEARLCKRAALGLLWSVSFVVVALPTLFMVGVVEEGVEPGLGERLWTAFAWLCLAGALGGPVLSGIAATSIRHSGGRLSGLGMAFIGAWIPPLIVIDAFAFWALAVLVDLLTDKTETINALQAVSLLLILVLNVVFLVRLTRREARATAGLNPQPGS